jgi:hypothetical protein
MMPNFMQMIMQMLGGGQAQMGATVGGQGGNSPQQSQFMQMIQQLLQRQQPGQNAQPVSRPSITGQQSQQPVGKMGAIPTRQPMAAPPANNNLGTQVRGLVDGQGVGFGRNMNRAQAV